MWAALWLPRLDHNRGIPKRALKLATASLCFIPRSGRGISALRVCKGKEQVGGGGQQSRYFSRLPSIDHNCPSFAYDMALRTDITESLRQADFMKG
jgi:hypothetical protein